MGSVERYIFRTCAGAFLAGLVGLTGVIWVTQALRELDLVTAKGQTFLIFLLVTGLSLPTLVTVIAPVALFAAVLYVLAKLNGDSELIVMSAAGWSPRRLLRPFLTLGLGVAGAIGLLTLYVMPSSFQELRDLVTRIRADFVANIVKEGQFTQLENGITFHFRERGPGGALLGILMQDRREAGRAVVYLAARGQAIDRDGGSYLVLEGGSVHRQQPGGRDPSIIAFERYALDLAAFTPADAETIYKPRERSTTQLLFPDAGETYYKAQRGRFRAELHDRLSAPLYPIALVFIAFAALGEARTTRQGRGAAIAGAIAAAVGLRIAGFAAASAAVRSPAAAFALHAVPLLAIAISVAVAFGGTRGRALGLLVGRRIEAGLLALAPRRARLST